VLLIGVAAIGVGTDPSVTLAPAISADLGHSTALVGPFATAFGVGAGAGFALIPVARAVSGLETYGTLGMGLLCAGVAGLLLGNSPMAAIAAFVIAGAGLTVALTGLSATLQLRTPDTMRGRIMALWSVAFLGSRPFAGAVNGALTDAVSLDAALCAVLVTVALAAVLCWLSDRRTNPRPPHRR
jgi:predicted MFS family arabinose efflux permease